MEIKTHWINTRFLTLHGGQKIHHGCTDLHIKNIVVNGFEYQTCLESQRKTLKVTLDQRVGRNKRNIRIKSMEQQILNLIQEEVERRVTDRLGKVIDKISQTYDISIRQLLRDVETLEKSVPVSRICLGVNKKKQRCQRPCKDGNSYCHLHLDQKPIQRVPRATSSANIEHTHTLPPMFMSGCPACEKTRSVRIDI